MDNRKNDNYYAFKAFNELYKLENQAEVKCDTEKVYAVAAVNGENACVVVANPYLDDMPLELCFEGEMTKCVITCEGKIEEETEVPRVLPKNSFLIVWVKL